MSLSPKFQKGLSEKEAADKLAQHGFNELADKGGPGILKIFLSQFKNVMIFILLGAMVLSFVVGERLDSAAIFVIVILNAAIGFVQEFRAEKTIEAMKKFTAPFAYVIRGGIKKKIPARELVPGDLIIIEEGQTVPADAKIIESFGMFAMEAVLTGESLPVAKVSTDKMHISKNADKKLNEFGHTEILGEIKDYVFMGTTITRGHGLGLITATGMKSEMGKIANMVKSEERSETPLQKKLDELSKKLAFVVGILITLLFSLSIIAGRDIYEMLLLCVSLAVAVIPEGLPAVVTITLASGVRNLSRENALVRQLASAETLGSTTVICSDKTGTLTQNKMTVQRHFTYGEKDFEMLLKIAVLCNNSDERTGDPTESALVSFAQTKKTYQKNLTKSCPRISEIVFDSERKRMATINKIGTKNVLLCKGAVDSLLKICSHVSVEGKIKKMNPVLKRQILKMAGEYSEEALRVLGFAYGENTSEEKNLIFVGMVGMIDPPRPETRGAIQKCRAAGIKVVMITGDHAITALAIAKEIGLIDDQEYLQGKNSLQNANLQRSLYSKLLHSKIHAPICITGEQLDRMTEKDLSKIIQNVKIFARVNPAHKVKILEALKKKGEIVAMTGDGVNDAPALNKADIGIAMGITGTDVAKQSAHMILLDDNFSTIVKSVEMGRVIYSNIKRFIKFLLSTNFHEIAVISMAFAVGLPIPLLPLQILWVNLLTDSLPATALGIEKDRTGIMERKPINPKENIFAEVKETTLIAGLISTIIGFGIFVSNYWSNGIENARTMYMCTSVVFQLLFAYSVRFENKNFFANFFSNRFLTFSVGFSAILQIIIVYWQPAQKIFKTVPLSIYAWSEILLYCAIGIAIIEVWKLAKCIS